MTRSRKLKILFNPSPFFLHFYSQLHFLFGRIRFREKESTHSSTSTTTTTTRGRMHQQQTKLQRRKKSWRRGAKTLQFYAAKVDATRRKSWRKKRVRTFYLDAKVLHWMSIPNSLSPPFTYEHCCEKKYFETTFMLSLKHQFSEVNHYSTDMIFNLTGIIEPALRFEGRVYKSWRKLRNRLWVCIV